LVCANRINSCSQTGLRPGSYKIGIAGRGHVSCAFQKRVAWCIGGNEASRGIIAIIILARTAIHTGLQRGLWSGPYGIGAAGTDYIFWAFKKAISGYILTS
tara:strand:+ start:142 stop:444 length:303 start_codon:yes stop_codon:yes gene_type:complete